MDGITTVGTSHRRQSHHRLPRAVSDIVPLPAGQEPVPGVDAPVGGIPQAMPVVSESVPDTPENPATSTSRAHATTRQRIVVITTIGLLLLVLAFTAITHMQLADLRQDVARTEQAQRELADRVTALEPGAVSTPEPSIGRTPVTIPVPGGWLTVTFTPADATSTRLEGLDGQ